MEAVTRQTLPMINELLGMVDGKELPGVKSTLVSSKLHASAIKTSPESLQGLSTGPSEIGAVRWVRLQLLHIDFEKKVAP